MKKQERPEINLENARKERHRLRYRRRYRRTLFSTVSILMSVAAFCVLIANFWMPVLEVYGSSMTPALEEGDVVLANKSHSFQTGDIIAFYYNNKILVKRVIAGPGDWVDISSDGTVSVNGEVLNEPYIDELSYGDTNIDLPYQVEDSHYFVMGDHRSVSMDSRHSSVGTVAEEQIVGRLMLTVWPLRNLKVMT